MRKNRYEILKQTGTSYNLPIFLESSVDEMGVMVGFDGDIEQIEQLVNFSYTQTGSTIQVYSTVNPDKLRKIVEQTYTINWGDGLISGLTVNGGVIEQPFPSLQHTYNTFYVTNNSSGNFVINGSSNPTLKLVRGETYTFNVNSVGHPFWIKTVSSTGTGNQYNNGITNNGTSSGTITFVVPTGATSTLYYNCQYHSGMNGIINLVNVRNTYTISINLDAPFTKQKLSKEITIPINTTITNSLGSFTGTTVPAYSNLTGQTQDYLNDFDITNNTGYTTTGFTYLAVGGSRLDELKKYGLTGHTQTLTSGSIDEVLFTGYTFTYTGNTTGTTILQYMDFEDGYTMITGSTTGFTKEEVFNTVITRNEHFLGFIDEPTIYSDLFVERGKQGVMETNLRLSEIDNVGELDVYGNGYFNVRKQ